MGRDEVEEQPYSSSSSTDSTNTNTNNNVYNDANFVIDWRSIDTGSSSSISSSTRKNNDKNGYYCYKSKDLSTDLRLGLTISSICSSHDLTSTTRGQCNDWPPIKPQLRNTLARKCNRLLYKDSLFIKVYMDGIPIGRELNLLAHCDYHSLISTLSHMFNTTILLFPEIISHTSSEENHILTYEDKEGDWMMVGDVPWELFLTTVSRLKIVVLYGDGLRKNTPFLN